MWLIFVVVFVVCRRSFATMLVWNGFWKQKGIVWKKLRSNSRLVLLGERVLSLVYSTTCSCFLFLVSCFFFFSFSTSSPPFVPFSCKSFSRCENKPTSLFVFSRQRILLFPSLWAEQALKWNAHPTSNH